jgi:hypothetical protein
MRYLKWPLTDDGHEAGFVHVTPESVEKPEIWFLDAQGRYWLAPLSVIQNLHDEFEQIKKAENPKALLPAPVLSLFQLTEVPSDVALILLAEQSLDKHK